MRAVVEDPQVYKSSDVARVSGRIKRTQDEIANALAALKEGEREQLTISHEEYRSLDEYAALDGDTKARVDEVFEHAARELDGAQGAYEIKGFTANYMERNAGRILSLLNPSKSPETPVPGGTVKPDPAPVQSVSVSEVCKRVIGSPLIKSEEDVDAYLDGLKALLLDEIRSGKVVMK